MLTLRPITMKINAAIRGRTGATNDEFDTATGITAWILSVYFYLAVKQA